LYICTSFKAVSNALVNWILSDTCVATHKLEKCYHNLSRNYVIYCFSLAEVEGLSKVFRSNWELVWFHLILYVWLFPLTKFPTKSSISAVLHTTKSVPSKKLERLYPGKDCMNGIGKRNYPTTVKLKEQIKSHLFSH